LAATQSSGTWALGIALVGMAFTHERASEWPVPNRQAICGPKRTASVKPTAITATNSIKCRSLNRSQFRRCATACSAPFDVDFGCGLSGISVPHSLGGKQRTAAILHAKPASSGATGAL
jgi:hypothetical protein